MKYFVTGGLGFIGSHMVDRLLSLGNEVVVYDNLSNGFKEFLGGHQSEERLEIVKGDLLDLGLLTASMENCDFVFHFAANADVRFDLDHPRKDLGQNTIATFHVLEPRFPPTSL